MKAYSGGMRRRLDLGLLLAFALCLSWAWTALGLVLRTTQAVMSTGTVVLFPLTLASNVFVQPRTQAQRPGHGPFRRLSHSREPVELRRVAFC